MRESVSGTSSRNADSYLPGAVAITDAVSTDGRSLREPVYIQMFPDTAAADVEANTLTVYMWPIGGTSEMNAGLITFDYSLYSDYTLTLCDSAGNQPASPAYFDSAGSFTNNGDTITVPFATIDLSGVHWTSVPNGLTYISVNSPTTDPTYHGQSIGVYPPDSWALMPSPTTEIYDAYTAPGGCGGVTSMAQIQQSLAWS